MAEHDNEQPAAAQQNPEQNGQPPHFLDRYTSATADLSAGGVGEALYSEDQPVDSGRRDPGSTSLPTSPTNDPRPATTSAAAGPTVSDTAAWTDARPRPVYGSPSATTPPPPIPPRADTYTPRNTETWEPSMDDLNSERSGPPRGLIFGVSGGTLAVLGGAVGATYWYTRRQRERNKPINRLRRQARKLSERTSDLVDRTGDLAGRLQEREVATPVGAGSALVLVAALALARALRGGHEGDTTDSATETLANARETRDLVLDQALTRLRGLNLNDLMGGLADAASSAVAAPADAARAQLAEMNAPCAAPTRGLGAGMVGMAALGAAGYLVWRMLRGDPQPWDETTWNTGTHTHGASWQGDASSMPNSPDSGNAPNH